MSHNNDPGQYSLFDDQIPKEPVVSAPGHFALQPIAGATEQPERSSEAWDDIGNRAPVSPELKRTLGSKGIDKTERLSADEARLASHQSTLRNEKPGMLSSLSELNPPEKTEAQKVQAHAAYQRGRALLGKVLEENARRRQNEISTK